MLKYRADVEKTIFFPKGSIVCCNYCDTELLIQKVNIRKGTTPMAEYFEPISPQAEPKNGDTCVCWKCGKEVHPFINVKIADLDININEGMYINAEDLIAIYKKLKYSKETQGIIKAIEDKYKIVSSLSKKGD